ncbi:hypothetical protein ACFW3D_23730 [Streptomyces sp. NPDC058864]
MAAVCEGDAGLTRWDHCLRLAERHPGALEAEERYYAQDGAPDFLKALLEVARALAGRPGATAGLLAARRASSATAAGPPSGRLRGPPNRTPCAGTPTPTWRRRRCSSS